MWLWNWLLHLMTAGSSFPFAPSLAGVLAGEAERLPDSRPGHVKVAAMLNGALDFEFDCHRECLQSSQPCGKVYR